MKTFVTGATGLVGGNLVRALISKGEAVRVFIREKSNTIALNDLEVERHYGDIRDKDSLALALKDCCRVYHCAASVSQWRGNLSASKEININGTINIMEEALRAGVERVVYVSTVDTLGLSSRENPADENSSHESMAKFRNPYVDTKYEAEIRAWEFVKKGLNLVVVNPTYMFGPWDVRPSSGQMILEVARGMVVGYPGGGNNFVDVEDVVQGMIIAMESGRAGEKYILANRDGNLTYREMFTLIAEVVGVKPPRFRIPYVLALAGGYMSDIYGKLTGSEPQINSVTARLGYAPHYFSPAKAIKELGIPQSPVEGAVRRAFEWFKKHGYL
ncbi:MAG: SDR family oxidoreductase [Deltaproteobacteria bacterium]|nr:MAG: SDR family oxidoreductase [Deltaproteobacteria bacterium]